MKKVFTTSDQVIHLWANQSQESARCKNVFFDGTSLYSYGYHYKLGEIVSFNGKTVALINNEGYSHTTQKHIRQALSACSHLPTLTIEGELSIDRIEESLLNEQNELMNDLFNIFSRRSVWLEGRFNYNKENYIPEFNKKCLDLGFEHLSLELDQNYSDLVTEHLQKVSEKILKRTEEKNKNYLEQQKVDIENWRKGGVIKYSIRNLPFQLIRITNEKIITSSGAEISLDEGVKAYKKLISNELKENDAIGDFNFTNTQNLENDKIVIIGCHKILMSEIRNVLGKIVK